MAEANRERTSPRVWPWVLGLAILALVVWALAESMAPDPEQDAATEDVVEELRPPPSPPAQVGARITRLHSRPSCAGAPGRGAAGPGACDRRS